MSKPVLPRCDFLNTFKILDKMTAVIKTGHRCNFSHGTIGICQQFRGFCYTEIQEIFVWRKTQQIFKAAGTFRDADIGTAGNRCNGNIGSKILVNKRKHRLQILLLFDLMAACFFGECFEKEKHLCPQGC